MCNCLNTSVWAQNAQNFLNTHAHDASWHTVNFLFHNNHCGSANGVFMDYIIQDLQNNGFQFGREQFQHDVLIPLKQQGILVSSPYPGIHGGIFIPCTENEVRDIARLVLDRVNSELTNLTGSTNATTFGARIDDLINEVQTTLNNI